MHLVSLIAGQVQSRQDLFNKEGSIMNALVKSGYHPQDVDTALTMMQSLSLDALRAEQPGDALMQGGMRTMTAEERTRFAVDAFGFVSKLALLGIITADQREEIIEKALSLHRRKIGLSDVKPLLILNFFEGRDEPEEDDAPVPERKGASWH
ncbi:MAG: DUF494 family protein [Nitrospiraceae bacterium]|nr:DUF494 family protein [Nitrospiraceae bacterium]